MNEAKIKDLNTRIAVEVMGWKHGVALTCKDGTHAGVRPADSKIVNPDAGCWSISSKGGTYPFITQGGTVFRSKGGGGEDWSPVTDDAQAMEVMDKLRELGFEPSVGYSKTFETWWASHTEDYEGPTVSERHKSRPIAICLMALNAMSLKR